MARDTSLPLRQAIVTRLRADAGLTAIVPAARVYGMRSDVNPTYPFTRYGSPDALPFKAQCLDGATVSFTIHSFSEAGYEDECASINAAVASALDDVTLDLEPNAGFPAKAHLRWIGSQIVPDAAEASVWHGIDRFEAGIAS
jgi:hypothetical protein